MGSDANNKMTRVFQVKLLHVLVLAALCVMAVAALRLHSNAAAASSEDGVPKRSLLQHAFASSTGETYGFGLGSLITAVARQRAQESP